MLISAGCISAGWGKAEERKDHATLVSSSMHSDEAALSHDQGICLHMKRACGLVIP